MPKVGETLLEQELTTFQPLALPQDDANVATPSLAYSRMEPFWDINRSLYSGTDRMRSKGTAYLPKHPLEGDSAYKDRLNKATLTNLYGKTIEHMTGKVFARDIQLGDDMPEELVEWAEDIDGNGSHLNVFGRMLFQDALQTGIAYIMVDMPSLPDGATRKDELELRPYWVHYAAEDVLSVRLSPGGEIIEARILETYSEWDGFAEKARNRIRQWLRDGDRVGVHTWEQDDEGNWIPATDEPVEVGVDVIPLVPVYGKRVGRFEGRPPLQDLAHKNVQLWQSESEQQHVVSFARFPILFGAGWPDEDESGGKVPFAPDIVVTNENTNAKLEYVEHTGAAIKAGREEIEDLKMMCAVLGLQMLLPRTSGVPTATETEYKYVEQTSNLFAMAINLRDALENAFGMMKRWKGEDVRGESGSVAVNTKFGISQADAKDVANFITLWINKLISRERLRQELVRRGFLDDDFDPEAEDEIIAKEQQEDQDEGADLPPKRKREPAEETEAEENVGDDA